MKSLSTNLCPVCGETALTPIIDEELQTYNNQEKLLKFYYSYCDCCGVETTSAEQSRQNKREMIKFKKEVDNLLSGEQIRKIRTDLGLSIKQAGLVFGGGPVAFSKYENDDLVQSMSMDSALRLAKINPKSVFYLAKERGVVLSQPKPVTSQPLLWVPSNSEFAVSIAKASRNLSNQHDTNTIPVNFISQSPNSFVEVYCV